ncbi:MAG: SAM-dependent methyltransferase, partial [Bacteroidales bacterium]|nr:SAM-dependent methyltransferase [Bacteroidales bacterium]
MHLHNNLQNQYAEDQLSARDAQQMAFLYAWGPAVFQTARLLVEWGILSAIDGGASEHSDKCSMHDEVQGLTVDEVAEKTGQSRLSVACLMEAGLTTRILLIAPETERYRLSKIGWFLLHDEMIHVDQTFCQQVNYEGMFRMDEALRTNQPVG